MNSLSLPLVQKSQVRSRKHFVLDAYMNAFGRRSRIVEPEDVEIAIKVCARQLIIRKVFFVTEVPDVIGHYLNLLKNLTEKMSVSLVKGKSPELVARSRSDFETDSHAFRKNELHFFKRAWDVYAGTYLRAVTVKKSNGREYVKYLPAEKEAA